MPTPRRSSTRGSPRADEALDDAGDHDPRDSLDEVARGNGAPIPDTTAVVGAAASEAVVGEGSPTPKTSAAT
jgi:hypothetical protein